MYTGRNEPGEYRLDLSQDSKTFFRIEICWILTKLRPCFRNCVSVAPALAVTHKEKRKSRKKCFIFVKNEDISILKTVLESWWKFNIWCPDSFSRKKIISGRHLGLTIIFCLKLHIVALQVRQFLEYFISENGFGIVLQMRARLDKRILRKKIFSDQKYRDK